MAPSLAVVSTTLFAIPVPVLLIVIVAMVLAPLHDNTLEVEIRGAPAQAVLQPNVKLNVTLPRLVAPSCNCRVSVITSPQLPFAVNAKFLVTDWFIARAPYDCGADGARTFAVDSREAVKLLAALVPVFLSVSATVTVSPGSIVPLTGGQLS